MSHRCGLSGRDEGARVRGEGRGEHRGAVPEDPGLLRSAPQPRCAIGIINFEVSTGLVQHVGFRGQAHLEAHDTERMKRLLGRYMGELENWDSRFVKILDDTNYIFVRFEPETVVVREQSYQVSSCIGLAGE